MKMFQPIWKQTQVCDPFALCISHFENIPTSVVSFMCFSTSISSISIYIQLTFSLALFPSRVLSANQRSVPSTAAATRTPSPVKQVIGPGRLRSLYPPSNYGAVVAGSVYRSSYPETKNYEFLETLKLKTILSEALSC